MNFSKKEFYKYFITILIASSITYLYISSKDIKYLSNVEKYKVLADGFTLPGILLLCIGALVSLSNTGTLDGVIYGVRTAIRMLLPLANKDKNISYLEYLEDRKKKRAKGYGFIYIVGLIFTLIAIYFMYKFYQIY